MAVNILVVDDSTTIQKVIRIAFSKYRVTIATAASYIEAISEIHTRKPDVILADACLNGVKSTADFARLRREANGAPLVLLVGTYDNVEEKDFEAAELSAVVKKPFESSDIIRIVSDVIGQDLDMDLSATEPGRGHERHHATTIMPPSPRDTHILPPPPHGSTMSDLAEKTIRLPDNVLSEAPRTERLPELPATDLHVTDNPDVPMTTLPDLTIEPPTTAFDLERGDRDLKRESEPMSPIAVSAKKGLKAFDQRRQDERPAFTPPPPPPADEDELNGLGEDVASFSLHDEPEPDESEPEPGLELEAIEAEPDNFAKARREEVAATQPHQVGVREVPVSFSELKAVLDPLVRDEMAALVRGAVEEYCARHFPALVREIVTAEIRRLTEEKARLLVDS